MYENLNLKTSPKILILFQLMFKMYNIDYSQF